MDASPMTMFERRNADSLYAVAFGVCSARHLALASLAGLVLCLGGCATSTGKPWVKRESIAPPVMLANTAVYDLPAADSGYRYQVWVDVPPSYAHSDKVYPVIFVTDALYTFPIVRSIRNLVAQGGENLEEFILVGLPPEQGLTSKASRSRDYTPSNPLDDPIVDVDDYSAKRYGEAAAFRDYIKRQVFPLVATRYRADMSRRIYAGHSYGGLFGSFVLLTRPEMFSTYILSSPSLWFNRRDIFKIEAAYAATHRDLAARVKIYHGMYETVRPEPHYNRRTEMVGLGDEFATRLRSRGYPSLSIDTEVIPAEDHLTVFPETITQALFWALPGSQPYRP
jgi:predicted alpha/beta superfamily hydrolase